MCKQIKVLMILNRNLCIYFTHKGLLLLLLFYTSILIMRGLDENSVNYLRNFLYFRSVQENRAYLYASAYLYIHVLSHLPRFFKFFSFFLCLPILIFQFYFTLRQGLIKRLLLILSSFVLPLTCLALGLQMLAPTPGTCLLPFSSSFSLSLSFCSP